MSGRETVRLVKKVTITHDGASRAFERDLAQEYADARLREVSNRLHGVYQEAARDMRMKLTSWEHAHEARVLKYRAQVETGEITEADFRAWMQGQLFQERAWKLKQEQLARSMVDVDRQAMRMINDGRIDVFAEAANYLGYQIESGGGADFGFGLYDRQTVSRLIRDDPALLPMPDIDDEKDFAWYNGVISRAVTQGILQGEDLDGIVMRVALDTGEKSLAAMRRNARTAYTGAQNAGRLEGMRQARDELGIGVKKRWMATLDDKTRDAHADLDGQVADIDEPFETPLGGIMYPGDPDADPALVYNCRCTLTYVYPKYNSGAVPRTEAETGENVGAMTYREWQKSKAEGG